MPLGLVPDDPSRISATITSASDIDMLVTAGGVSVGDHDHVRAVMLDLGTTLHFTRVLVRPGGPTTFGTRSDARPWIGLPGNPVSAMVTFELFARPAIRKMAGCQDTLRQWFDAELGEDVQPDSRLDLYLRCTFDRDASGKIGRAITTGPQGSGMLMSVARSEGLVSIPAGTAVRRAGETVRCCVWSAG